MTPKELQFVYQVIEACSKQAFDLGKRGVKEPNWKMGTASQLIFKKELAKFLKGK